MTGRVVIPSVYFNGGICGIVEYWIGIGESSIEQIRGKGSISGFDWSSTFCITEKKLLHIKGGIEDSILL